MKIYVLFGLVFTSTGDQQFQFQDCSRKCGLECPVQLPLSLRITRWTCVDNCKYYCMHTITDKAIQNNEKVHQYYGKWPFYRLWGMQEPASVLFSICNGYYHFQGLAKYRKLIGKRFPWRNLMVFYGCTAINTWFWSSVFHTRDLPFTEKMDYFSAMLSLLSPLFYTIHRIARIRLFSALSNVLILFFTGFFIIHISYLSFYRFDYGYNMKASIVVGLAHSVIWLSWVAMQYKQRPYAYKMAICVLSLCTAMSLELLDFAPFGRVIDAHSLWHAATIPVVWIYWEFAIEDAMAESRNKQ